jgi:hypothetical protein
MGDEIVKLVTGKKRKVFNVHKKLLCDASKFFNDAFNGPFKEGYDGTMYMPEDDPDVITRMISWLYRNPLPFIEDPGEPVEKTATKADIDLDPPIFGPPTKAEHQAKLVQEKKEVEREKNAQLKRLEKQFNQLFQLYFFAERLFIDELKNRAIDRIRQGMRQYDRHFTTSDYKIIYANTTRGSPFRKLCTDTFVFELISAKDKRKDTMAAIQKQVPEITRDLLDRFQETAQNLHEIYSDMDSDGCGCFDCCEGHGPSDPRDNHLNLCRFHEHIDSECYLEDEAIECFCGALVLADSLGQGRHRHHHCW